MASIEGQRLGKDFYETLDYPAKGFIMELNNIDELNLVAQNVFKVVKYLTDNEVAHNVFMTRGTRSLSHHECSGTCPMSSKISCLFTF